MAPRWIEAVTGSLEEKKQYKPHKARVKQLPESYRVAVEALERYYMYFGGITRSDVMLRMLDDLADLFEQAAADATPIRAIVGDDPVEFAETFLANYSEGQWINKERTRLIDAIDRVGGHRHEDDAGRMPCTQHDRGEPAITVRALEKSYARTWRSSGRRLRRGARQHLRAARLQRRRQDHGRAGSSPPCSSRCRHGERQRLRRRDAARAGAASRSA